MKKNLILLFMLLGTFVLSAQNAATFKKYGNETQGLIESKYRYTNSKWYRESTTSGDYHATCWPMGIYIKALYYIGTPQSKKMAGDLLDGFHSSSDYLTTYKGYTAYEACHKLTGTRHYDDNAWMVKDLMDMYELTGTEKYLTRAKQIMLFCMSGERTCKDDNCSCGKNYQGGIRFHEDHSTPTHKDHGNWATCATAPVAVSNLKLYKATKDEKYLTDGKRLYDFMKNQKWGIGPGYRAYENAVVMQAALLLYEITEEQAYLDDTYQLAYSIESMYISWSDGVLHEAGKWGGHDVADAYVSLYNLDKDERWLGIVAGYADYTYKNCRDKNGFYPEDWSNTVWKDTVKTSTRDFIEQASAAATYYRLASTPVTGVKKKEPVAIFRDAYYNRINSNKQGDVNGVEQSWGHWSIGLKPGRYTMNDLHKMGMINNRFEFDLGASSILIEEGYRVTVYAGANFNGVKKVFEASAHGLGNWDNRIASIVVEDLNPSVIDNVTPIEQLEIYPTNFSDEVTIQNISGDATVEMISLSGKVWLSEQVSAPEHTLSTGSLPAGIYLMKVKTGDQQQVFKLIKTN